SSSPRLSMNRPIQTTSAHSKNASRRTKFKMDVTKMIVTRTKRLPTSKPQAAKAGKTESKYRLTLCSNGSVFFSRKKIKATKAYNRLSTRSFMTNVGAEMNRSISRLNASSRSGACVPSARPLQNGFKLAHRVSHGNATWVFQYFG